MKLSDVMYSDLTDEQFRQLSDKERALWIMRPRDPVPRARTFMYIRAALIVAAFIYYRHAGEIRALLIFVGCYEFAYFNSVKGKLDLQHMLARERYAEQVQELEGPIRPAG